MTKNPRSEYTWTCDRCSKETIETSMKSQPDQWAGAIWVQPALASADHFSATRKIYCDDCWPKLMHPDDETDSDK